MPSPSFVNVGTFTFTTDTHITPSLPGSRVNGNLLVAYARSGAHTMSLSGSGWTQFETVDQGGPKVASLAYRYVDGTEGAPTFTLGAGATDSLNAWIAQYTGVVGSNPIGNISTNESTTTVSTMTCPAITTAAANSLAVFLAISNGSSQVPTPSGWTLEAHNESIGGFLFADKALSGVGSSSGAISLTYTSAYRTFIFEVQSQAAPPPTVLFSKLKQYLRR